jgi:hypothetical protein
MKNKIKLRIENVIRKIIGKIRQGRVFDSHYVINKLISEHSDVYLLFASELLNSHKTVKERGITIYIHSQIAQKIGDPVLSDLVTRVELDGKETKFWSDNIHEKASDCAGWRRK